jgi:hypothetical protein
MRKIGKAKFDWKSLIRKKGFFKFITERAVRQNTILKVRRIRTNLTFKDDDKTVKISRFIVMPTSYSSIITDFLADIGYIVSFFLVLYVLSSKLNLHSDFQYYEIVIDFILLVDMVMRFITAYDNDLEKVTDHKTIAVRYLANSFVFDFIAIVPGFVTMEFITFLYPLKLLRYFQIPRFFDRMDFALTTVANHAMIIDKAAVKLIMVAVKSILTLLLAIHVFT